jgi:chorismate mutase
VKNEDEEVLVMKKTGLSWWRKKIDEVDMHILELLAKRKRIAEKIAEVKMSNGMNIFDAQREKRIIKARQNLAAWLKLDKDFVRSLMSLLLRYSKRVQKDFLHS